jgi:hypothetical protein
MYFGLSYLLLKLTNLMIFLVLVLGLYYSSPQVLVRLLFKLDNFKRTDTDLIHTIRPNFVLPWLEMSHRLSISQY